MDKRRNKESIRPYIAASFAREVVEEFSTEFYATIRQLMEEDFWGGDYPTREAILSLYRHLLEEHCHNLGV